MKTSKHTFAYLLAMVGLFAFAGAAHAAAWDGAAEGVKDAMYGPIGTTLAILGVAGVGIAAFFGKMDWGRAGMVIGGIVIFFSAPAIVTYVKSRMQASNDFAPAPIYAVVEMPTAPVYKFVA